MKRLKAGLAGLLLLAAGNVWALPMQWDGVARTARIVTVGRLDGEAKEMDSEGTAGQIARGLTSALQRGAVLLLGLGSLSVAVYSKRRSNEKNT